MHSFTLDDRYRVINSMWTDEQFKKITATPTADEHKIAVGHTQCDCKRPDENCYLSQIAMFHINFPLLFVCFVCINIAVFSMKYR